MLPSDDALPGAPLELRPYADSLTSIDTVDVYSVYLHEGETLALDFVPGAGLSATLSLLGPEASSLDDAPLVLAQPGEIFGNYVVPAGGSGRYAVVVSCVDGGGPYALTPSWLLGPELDDPDLSNNVPGDTLSGTHYSGTVTSTDRDDVVAVDLVRGEKLQVDWYTGPSSPVMLYFYGPNTEDVDQDPWITRLSRGNNLTYVVEESGTYYIDLYYSDGRGSYTVDLTVTPFGEQPDAPSEVPGLEIPPSPFVGGIDASANDTADTYRVWAAAGQEISALVQSDSDDLSFTLEYETGEEWTETIGSSRRTAFGADRVAALALWDGWYDLVLRSDSNTNYTVTWTVQETDNYLPGLPLSSPVEGAVDWSTDRRDFVSAKFQAGNLVTVSLEGTAGLDADLAVYEPGDAEEEYAFVEADGTEGTETVTFQATKTGVYSIGVSAAAGSGDYQLSWTATPPTGDDQIPGVPLAIGSSVAATSTQLTDPMDVYQVRLYAGRKYRFTTTGTNYSPGMMLFAPGTPSVWDEYAAPVAQAWADETANQLTFVCEATGDYSLATWSNTTQSYTLSSVDGGAASSGDVYHTAQELTAAKLLGSISADNDWIDWYAIPVYAGERLGVKLKTPAGSSISMDLFGEWSMEDAYGSEQTSDGSLRARMVSPDDGYVYVRIVAHQGSGAYELLHAITEAEEDDYAPGVQADASPVLGTVSELADWSDSHKVWLEAGKLVAVRMASPDVDAKLTLGVYSMSEDALYESDGLAAEQSAVFMPAVSGFYTFTVGSEARGNVAVPYSLTWSSALGSGPDDVIPGVPLAGQQPVLGNAGSVTDSLELLSDNSDVYRIALDADQKLEATLAFDGADDFSMVAYNDDALSFLDYEDAASSTIAPGLEGLGISQSNGAGKRYYYIRVKSDGGSGEYTLSWKVTPADDEYPGVPRAASVTDHLDASMDANDFSYAFVRKGQTIRASLTGAAGTNFDLLLYGTEMVQPIASSGKPGSDESIQFVAPRDMYVIFQAVAQSGAGDYVMSSEIKWDTTLTLSSASAVKLAYNQAMSVAGTLTANGAESAGKPVTLLKSVNGTTWVPTGLSATTGTGGGFAFPVNVTAKTYYKVSFAGQAEYRPGESGSIYYMPYALLGKPSKPSTARHGVPFTMWGSLVPGHKVGSSAVKIECWQLYNGRWVKRKTVTAKMFNATKYTARVTLPNAGKWKMRAVHADADHSTTTSAFNTTSYIRVP